ncbi:hypothetical protein ABT288_13365 [Streptomyces sp. NPDC001093]|uniref:hypothetical protein n=1 Tax=Streptomyces sp. NPDC001093 TaxID=3154376 RepID=UPI0033183D31
MVLIRAHVIGPAAHRARDLPPGEGNQRAEALERLRSLARNVMGSEMSMAMDRPVDAELHAWTHRGEG